MLYTTRKVILFVFFYHMWYFLPCNLLRKLRAERENTPSSSTVYQIHMEIAISINVRFFNFGLFFLQFFLLCNYFF